MSETVLSPLGDASVRSAVAAALVAIVLATLRIRSSSVRHASWTAVLAPMLLMPVLPYCVPTIPIPVPAPATRSGAHTLAADEPIRSNTGTPSIERDALAERPRISMSSQAVSNASTARAPALSDSAGRGLPRWRVAVLTVYAFGCFVLFVGTGIGWRGARRLARMSTPVDSDVDVAIRESPVVAAPITVGVLAPIILLPTGWRRWPGETLRAVLAHEIAHVRRRDPLVALVAHINRCVFWFHPLAWWLERALARYAEDASDDLALRVVPKLAW